MDWICFEALREGPASPAEGREKIKLQVPGESFDFDRLPRPCRFVARRQNSLAAEPQFRPQRIGFITQQGGAEGLDLGLVNVLGWGRNRNSLTCGVRLPRLITWLRRLELSGHLPVA